MHTDLSAHLHTDECNIFIKQLQDCHVDHSFLKWIGYCNDADVLMRKCLKAERIQRQLNNLQQSRVKHEQIRARIKAHDQKEAGQSTTI